MKGFVFSIKMSVVYSIAISIIISASTFGGLVYASDTGGYPWADATLVKATTYDWGYLSCQDAMIKAKTCSAHYGYKAGNRYHESDPWKYDVRNCTSFVAWKVNQIYQINISGWGDARNWTANARLSGYSASNDARVGDIAVWNGGVYGHVAYVTEVNPDGSVNIEQYNKAGKGEFSRQSRVRANSYIHVAPEVIYVPAIPVPEKIPEILSSTQTTQPLPEIKQPIEVAPEVVEQITQQEPPIVDSSVKYYVSSSNEKSVKAYAIRHNNTKSGNIEIQTSTLNEVDPKWSDEVVTPESVQPTAQMMYSIADYNADGIDDLYSVSYGNTNSNKVDVAVLDGSKGYSTYIGKWTTNETQHKDEDVQYLVSDYNGDGKLDLYQLRSDKTPENLVQLSIFDGASGFMTVLEKRQIPEPARPSIDTYFMLGDHNYDGVTDIYQIWHNNTPSGKTEIKVFSGRDSTVISTWKVTQPLYSGIGPVL